MHGVILLADSMSYYKIFFENYYLTSLDVYNPNAIVSNQKEEYISVQQVRPEYFY